jgi:hypothetical protein
MYSEGDARDNQRTRQPESSRQQNQFSLPMPLLPGRGFFVRSTNVHTHTYTPPSFCLLLGKTGRRVGAADSSLFICNVITHQMG